jgi:restriction system protein
LAEITPTRMGQLLQGVFEILKDQPDGLPAREVLARLERVVPPTDFEASTYPNRPGIRRYEKIVRFASINTVKAGWLLKDRGQWSVSEDGVQALEQHRDPERFFRAARDLYRVWKAEQPPEEEGVAVEEDSLSAATTLEEAEEAAWSEIETHLAEMNPYDFQKLVAGLLKLWDTISHGSHLRGRTEAST